MNIDNPDEALHFARGFLRSALRRVVENWPELMSTSDGRDTVLNEVTVAVSLLEMDGPSLVLWANVVGDMTGGDGRE
ncbi:hypothetical protein [Kutzneria sp. NPDC051319]|uniref:hypothetical protein n=1 Tax=Kutzneria sp. NPDC051319 TaxID=3155047 RepID=UPI00341B10E3